MSENQAHRMFLVLQEKIHFLFWLNIKPGTISLLAKEGGRKEHELFKNKIVAENLFDNRDNFIC